MLHDKRLHLDHKQIHPMNDRQFDYIDQAFSSFIGLDKLKKVVKEIYAMKVINDKRKEIGLKCPNQVLHMLFKGNPGTGKTTFARKLAKVFFNMNLLSKGHFIEAERADLVGEYIGQTAQKTRSMIQKSHGGILFIDEAYSLARGGKKDFGREAIDTLVTHMENNYDDLIIILAGYPHEMEHFLLLNPGLRSRFPFIFDFEDFKLDQLIEIAKQMYNEREYELTLAAEWKLREFLYKKTQTKGNNFSNARYVRNIIEDSIRMHAVRVLCNKNYDPDELIKIKESDLQLDKE